MKKSTSLLIFVAVFAVLIIDLAPAVVSAQSSEPLPEYIRIELKRLEETWNVLDQFAARVWPGWTGYRDVPFLFEYANRVRMLVGHPSPTDEFTLVPGLEVQGKKVYLDRRAEIKLEMKPPIAGGGGPLFIGKEKQVQTVWLKLSPYVEPKPEPGVDKEKDKDKKPASTLADIRHDPKASENQILINIHELFHCFQRGVYRYRFGNLRYNTDLNYAVHSEIEGLALEKAFLEPDDAKAKAFVKDFLAARKAKRTGSMTELEANQESEDDLMEGTAVYSTTRTLELMKAGYKPLIGKAEDPFFFGFADVAPYIDKEIRALEIGRSDSMEAKMKCYQYGCVQALLLSRFFPGWQDGFFQGQKFLDALLRDKMGLSDADLAAAAAGFKDRYRIADLEKTHGEVISNRDKAYWMIQARKGRVYAVNFKPTEEYLSVRCSGPQYKLGLLHIYPEGIDGLEIRDVKLTGAKSPIVQDELYFLRWVDTESRPGAKGYELKFASREGSDVYVDAEVKTGGFTLKAPKIRVQEMKDFVKITVLEKIKQ